MAARTSLAATSAGALVFHHGLKAFHVPAGEKKTHSLARIEGDGVRKGIAGMLIRSNTPLEMEA